MRMGRVRVRNLRVRNEDEVEGWRERRKVISDLESIANRGFRL